MLPHRGRRRRKLRYPTLVAGTISTAAAATSTTLYPRATLPTGGSGSGEVLFNWFVNGDLHTSNSNEAPALGGRSSGQIYQVHCVAVDLLSQQRVRYPAVAMQTASATDTTPPPTPTSVGLVEGSETQGGATLSHDALLNPDADLRWLRCHYAVAPADPTAASPYVVVNATAGATTSNLSGLPNPETTYRVALAAEDVTGNISALSGVVALTTAAAPAEGAPLAGDNLEGATLGASVFGGWLWGGGGAQGQGYLETAGGAYEGTQFLRVRFPEGRPSNISTNVSQFFSFPQLPRAWFSFRLRPDASYWHRNRSSTKTWAGCSAAAGSTTVNAGAGTFVASDKGHGISIPGAGAGGATLHTWIRAVVNGGQITVSHAVAVELVDVTISATSKTENNKLFIIQGGDYSAENRAKFAIEFSPTDTEIGGSNLRLLGSWGGSNTVFSLSGSGNSMVPDGPDCSGDAVPFIRNAGPILRGQWNRVRIYVYVGSAYGADDGAVKVWLNDTVVYDYAALPLYPATNYNGSTDPHRPYFDSGRFMSPANYSYVEKTDFDVDAARVYSSSPGW